MTVRAERACTYVEMHPAKVRLVKAAAAAQGCTVHRFVSEAALAAATAVLPHLTLAAALEPYLDRTAGPDGAEPQDAWTDRHTLWLLHCAICHQKGEAPECTPIEVGKELTRIGITHLDSDMRLQGGTRGARGRGNTRRRYRVGLTAEGHDLVEQYLEEQAG